MLDGLSDYLVQMLQRHHADGVRKVDHRPVLTLVEPTGADLTNRFAEQHQVDPDEAYRDAVYDEISDALIWLGWGALAAMLVIVGLLYRGSVL